MTGYYNNTTLFTQTFSVSQLPQNGKYTGFTGGRGGIDNFRASLAGDGGFARGIVQPYSININNGRGLQVFGQQENISGRIYQPGDIYVLAPGYYNFSVISVPSGRWGTASSDWYRYSLQLTDKNGNVRNVPMHNAYDMYSPALGNFTASLPAYAEGKVSFILETNDASATYIDTIEINIVRLA